MAADRSRVFLPYVFILERQFCRSVEAPCPCAPSLPPAQLEQVARERAAALERGGIAAHTFATTESDVEVTLVISTNRDKHGLRGASGATMAPPHRYNSRSSMLRLKADPPNVSNANLRGQGPRAEVERRAGCDGRRNAALEGCSRRDADPILDDVGASAPDLRRAASGSALS